jgi:hypothetical protein
MSLKRSMWLGSVVVVGVVGAALATEWWASRDDTPTALPASVWTMSPILSSEVHLDSGQPSRVATPAEQAAIDRDLSVVRLATERYRDVVAALADGYAQEGPALAGVGAHFVNWSLIGDEVDLRHPAVLLYERKLDLTLTLVGVAWLVDTDHDGAPPAAFAPSGVWHYHEYPSPGLCKFPDGAFVATDAEGCSAGGGHHMMSSPWILHAWLFRDNPDGMFANTNTNVDGFPPAFYSPSGAG